MKVVWITSGDELEFAPENHSLCEYFITNLAGRSLICDHSDVDSAWHDQLLSYLHTVNRMLEHTGIGDSFDIGDPYDQQYLNQLHRNWVKFHLANPNIIIFLQQHDQSLVAKFRGINSTLHKIEKMFVQSWIGIENNEVLTWNNPFENVLTFSTGNLQVFYNDLGRNTYNKWVNFDNVIDQEDTNDYKTLAAEIRLNLNRSEQLLPPTNYVEWCKSHGLTTVPGRWINLGDFVDLENRLTDYRKLLVRNNQQPMTLVL